MALIPRLASFNLPALPLPQCPWEKESEFRSLSERNFVFKGMCFKGSGSRFGLRSNEIHLGCFEIVDGNEFVFVFSDEGNPPLVESFKLTVSGSPGLVDKIKAAGIRLGVD